MATEAIKLIAGIGEPLIGRVLVLDSLRARQSEVPLRGQQVIDTAVREPSASDVSTRAAAPTPAVPAPAVPAISARALAEALASTAPPSMIDVREAWEVAGDPMPGALHVPLAAVLADPAAITGPVVVICQVGVRARRAAEVLRDSGVPATVLAGGMDAWHQTFADRPA
jgi:adenylyltransferase/sulfurtransferase